MSEEMIKWLLLDTQVLYFGRHSAAINKYTQAPTYSNILIGVQLLRNIFHRRLSGAFLFFDTLDLTARFLIMTVIAISCCGFCMA